MTQQEITLEDVGEFAEATPEWQEHPVTRRTDGSYVITTAGLPCHVPNEGEWADLWAEVDAYAQEHPEQVEEEAPPPEPTPEEIEEAAVLAARSAANTILTARMQRQLAQTDTFTPAEFATFARAGLYHDWTPGTAYIKGDRFKHEGIVYETQQPVTAQEHQPPGSEGMLAVYRPISIDDGTGEDPDGSLENPYPFISGMDVFAEKYYGHEGAIYLAKADMPACVWAPGTPGLWQWEQA